MTHPTKWWTGAPVRSYFPEPSFYDRAKTYLIGVLLATVIILLILIGTARAQIVSPWVSVAKNEIGHGETERDNAGPDVRRYLRGEEGKPWCAAFVSWCLNQTRTDAMPYFLRARSFLWIGEMVDNPCSGDLIVLWRGNQNDKTGHVGIIESVEGNTITTIEGNVGVFPAKVKRVVYQGKPKKLLGYVRLKQEILHD
ncbi:MAG: CHAP domain-containing protein [Candidatus Omnitrophota bacterium]|jgi:uncharacterized protein (TIGR02594 family)